MTSEHVKSNGRPAGINPRVMGPEERSESIPCETMPRLIVLRSIHHVPKALRASVEAHLRRCTQCRVKSIALDIASEAFE
jgi:hypothetical protein